MKPILLLNLAFGLFWAQQSTFIIAGSVRDSSGRAVTGVRVSVMDENFQPIRTIFVDSSGRFTVNGLRQGRFTFRVDTTGTPYEEQTQQLELQSLRIRGGGGAETFPLDITLKFKKGKDPGAGAALIFAQEVPGPAQKEYERGVKSLKSQKTDQAIAYLKKAIQIFPDYYDALELLGTEYIKATQFKDAIQLLAHALEVNKRSFKCMYGVGVAHLKLNQLPQAVEHLEKAAQMEPNSANAQMMLGLAYGMGGAFDKSEAAFRKALQIGGEAAAEAHFYLAGLFNKQERYGDAWQELEQFLKKGKDIKDPAQIKAMIEKLKEKEKSPPAETQAASVPAAPPSNDNQPRNRSAADMESGDAGASAETSANAVSLKSIPPLTPEFVELIRQSETAGGTMHKQLIDYTYQLKKTRRVLDEHGKSIHMQEQVFEAYPVIGEHVLIKLSSDGLPSRTVSDERKRAAKQLEEAERQRQSGQAGNSNAQAVIDDYVSAGVSGVYNGKAGYVSVNVSAFLRNCEFFSPRVEEVAGRPMAVLNFRPRSGVQLQNNFSYVAKLIGTVWIDQTDKIVTRLEAWPASEEAFDLMQSTAPQNDAALVYRQERQDNGLWFPSLIKLNANGRTDLFNGLNWEVAFEFGSYRRFDTSANEKINNPSSKTP